MYNFGTLFHRDGDGVPEREGQPLAMVRCPHCLGASRRSTLRRIRYVCTLCKNTGEITQEAAEEYERRRRAADYRARSRWAAPPGLAERLGRALEEKRSQIGSS
jgi:hypothetical protein